MAISIKVDFFEPEKGRLMLSIPTLDGDIGIQEINNPTLIRAIKREAERLPGRGRFVLSMEAVELTGGN